MAFILQQVDLNARCDRQKIVHVHFSQRYVAGVTKIYNSSDWFTIQIIQNEFSGFAVLEIRPE